MRTIPILVLISLAGDAVPAKAADYYNLPDIKRLENNLYQSAEVIIETRSCIHRASGEQALLKYEGPGKYQIIWEDHSTCEIEKVVALDASSNNLRQVRVNLPTRDALKAAVLSRNSTRS